MWVALGGRVSVQEVALAPAEATRRHLSVAFEGLDVRAEVVRMDAVEALSEPHHIVVELEVLEGELSCEQILGCRARLEVATRTAPRRFSSIVAAAESTPVPGLYRVSLIAPLAELSLHRSMRIFQNQSAIEVVTAIFARHGIAAS